MAAVCVMCHQSRPYRIVLRLCHHTLCLECSVGHLKSSIVDESAIKIPCPDDNCRSLIHPNDIWVLLTDKSMARYMATNERRGWLNIWEYNTIITALGGEHKTKRCPKCKEIYTQRVGCNWVRCARRECRTYFCWNCNEKCDKASHFLKKQKGACRLNWDDIYQGSFAIRMLSDTEGICLLMIGPWLILPLYLILPIYGFYCTIRALCRCTYRRMRRNNNRPLVLCYVIVALLSPLFIFPSIMASWYMLLVAVFIWILWNVTFNPCLFCINENINMFLMILGMSFSLVGSPEFRELIGQSKQAEGNKQSEIETADVEEKNRSQYESAYGRTNQPQGAAIVDPGLAQFVREPVLIPQE